jgi:hypothetical protein
VVELREQSILNKNSFVTRALLFDDGRKFTETVAAALVCFYECCAAAVTSGAINSINVGVEYPYVISLCRAREALSIDMSWHSAQMVQFKSSINVCYTSLLRNFNDFN